MTELAKLYGESLYDLAAEETLEVRILEELDGAAACIKAEPDYLRLLSTPSLPKEERCGLLDEAFGGGVHPYVVNFLKLLCREGALRELPGCAAAYRKRYNKAHGILEVTAVSAVALPAEKQAKLREKLAAMTGKTIDLTVKVDPSVLGGLRLDLDGTRLDGTVRRRLDAIRTDIGSAVL